MKKIIQLFAFLLLSSYSIAQTNTFPSSGNTGVGTTSPAFKLTVAGGEIKAFNYDYNTGIEIGAEATERPRIGFHVSDNNRRFKIEANDMNSSTERLGFFGNCGGGCGETEYLTINKSGNVGIGTTSPQTALAVNGTITAKKVVVTQSGWADYVFGKQYKLPSLQEIEKYIRQNKHLEGIPSTQQVEKDGVDIGDNQALLLKKVEELTLYVINLNKKVDQLSKENKSLRKNVKRK